MKSYKDLIVWQKGIQLVVLIYQLLNKFPKEEVFGLSSQIKRSAVSIPSNIAEGKMRGSNNEFRRFLLIAYGSGAELETQIEISKKLEKTKNLNYREIDELLLEIMKMLNKLINDLEPKA
ncbi:MAG: four helix bundle protein [Candidatus Paceibacterota bacterium]|jgi:four helix bundle protein